MNAPPKKTRQQQKEETRTLILNTATKLFNELGYEKTTMRMISKEAGVATGTAFTHYPDKKALLMDSMYNGIADTVKHAVDTLPREGDMVDILTFFAVQMFEYFGKNPDLSKALINEYLFSDGPWMEEIIIQLSQFGEFVTLILKESQRMGKLHPKSDCDLLAQSFIALYCYSSSMGLRNAWDLKTQEHIFRQHLDNLFFGHVVTE